MVLVDPSVFAEEEEIRETVSGGDTLADRLDNSVILKYSLGLMGLAFLALQIWEKGINLNILILLFLILGILAHRNLLAYSKALTKGAVTCGGIILQYPFYAGIMGIMKGSGLVFVISDWLLNLSTKTPSRSTAICHR